MTAVERVVEYETVDPEDELEASGDLKPPADWPQHGHIIFDKLSLRYFPGLLFIFNENWLDNLSILIFFITKRKISISERIK